MIAKVCLFLSALAAAQATLLTAGHLGSISAQSTAINHVAPVATIAAAPIAIGHGIGAPLAIGRGIVGPMGLGLGASNWGLGASNLGLGLGAANWGLGLGHGLAGNLRADGITGHGILGSRYGSAIAHNAVVGHGLIGGARYGVLNGLGGHGLIGGARYGVLGGLGGHGLGLGKVIL